MFLSSLLQRLGIDWVEEKKMQRTSTIDIEKERKWFDSIISIGEQHLKTWRPEMFLKGVLKKEVGGKHGGKGGGWEGEGGKGQGEAEGETVWVIHPLNVTHLKIHTVELPLLQKR